MDFRTDQIQLKMTCMCKNILHVYNGETKNSTIVHFYIQVYFILASIQMSDKFNINNFILCRDDNRNAKHSTGHYVTI